MKNIFWIMIFSIGLSISSYGQEKISIRVAEFAPFYFKDKNGNWQGLDVELAKVVIEKAGFNVEYFELPWSRALKHLETGKLDILMNVSMTDERKNKMNFIGPERYGQMGLLVKIENKDWDIKTFESLETISIEKNKKFGIQNGVFYGEEFNNKLKDPNYSKYFVETFSAEKNIVLLNNNKILGFFEDKLYLNYLIKTDIIYQRTVLHSFDGFPKEPIYFAISKKMSKDNYTKLKQVFDLLEKDGTLDKIRKKYE
ncbi:MAG: hypothetical protein A2086_12215 [Spirochaetes bacterium GWD1_27_9]|nr:MAG: hypothetical protein A2Z98_06685 [Spirochaetes bacterium GWB1_27_13]OHD26199.1 MAG: hypothetical protein A2Y34_09615 [Spirochaetes bacterium GWC1_27_15]OHD35745.1 MAG: hypothetical protein A2086_12215 [Spirochaetes bacterium GWD1_27_9]